MEYKLVKDNKGCTISKALILKPNIYKDERGYFYESWNQKKFNNVINQNISFVQDNESFSYFGVLRGMHYQLNPYAQGKLLRVIKGTIHDVLVDLRIESSTFLHWFGIDLSEENKLQLWIPEGFAHGFLTLTKFALVQYKVTNFWSKDFERTLKWNDKKVAIEWPLNPLNLNEPIVSKKDLEGKKIEDIINKGEIFK